MDRSTDWFEQKAEEEHRERIRLMSQSLKDNPIVWDDMDEKKCQERYRQKYSSH